MTDENPIFSTDIQSETPQKIEDGGGERHKTNFLRRLLLFKARTKLLGIFILMFGGLFYANMTILEQSRINNIYTERQAKIMLEQTMLSDAVSCFGAIKYWFAILDNGLKKNPVELPAAAEKGVRCDLDEFGNHLKNLEAFSKESAEIELNYERMRNLPKEAMMSYIEGDAARGEKAMGQAYSLIATIDEGLSDVTKGLKKESEDIVELAYARSEEFKKFPLMFLIIGATGIGLVSLVIFFNIFKPIENITSTMIDASKDPHNTRNYIVFHEGREDEVGEVMSALNSLLLQVHEGFTRTKEAEHEIAKTAQRLDAVFNSVVDGLVTVNAEGEIESINKSAYDIFGYDQEAIAGKKITDFLPASAAQKYMECLHNFISTGSCELVGCGPKEMFGRRLNGVEFPIELVVTNIPLDDGSFVFVNVIRDITARKELERQLLQAQKMEALGSLSSGIAHEINTPAQYVGDNIKFLKDSFQAYDGFYKSIGHFKDTPPTDMERMKEEIAAAEAKYDLSFFSDETPLAVEQSLEGVSRISEIVGAIKGFSYPATDEVIYVDMNEALRNTIIVSRNQWKTYAEMQTEFDENLPPVPCIPGKLTQVVLNLIINAAHAIEEKSKGNGDPQNNFIKISTGLDDKKVVIKVGDSGCGIPKENMTKIFDPFFTTKEVGKGTGQGLSISYDIVVKKHGGTLRVDSEIGKGTTFIIELPMEKEGVKGSAKNTKTRA